MSRYRKKYSKTFWGNDKVELYDRETGKSFSGTGLTKKEALDQAFDQLYENKRDSNYAYSNSNDDDSVNSYKYNPVSETRSKASYLVVGILLLVLSPIGCFYDMSHSDGGLKMGFFIPILLFVTTFIGIVFIMVGRD